MISNRVKELVSILDRDLDLYENYLMVYYDDTSINLRSDNTYKWLNSSSNLPQNWNLRRPACFNIVKSVIDTLVSAVYNKKVRSRFSPINGTYETDKAVKSCQIYFDNLFDKADVNKLVNDAFKLACIEGVGYIFINPFTYNLSTIGAHQVATFKTEARLGKLYQAMIRYDCFPVEYIEDYCGEKFDKELTHNECRLEHYINVKDHKQFIFVNGTKFIEKDYKPDSLPLLPIYFNSPVFDGFTTSIVHELYGLQEQVNMITSKIGAAAQMSSANRTFVFEGSNLTRKDVDNQAGNVYTVKGKFDGNSVPIVSTQDAPFNPVWQSIVDFYLSKAYQMIGVSELSAQAKKPAGADSGVALQTLEDVESDRQETVYTHYINSFTNLCKLLIEIMPDEVDVLPDSLNTSHIKWRDVKKEAHLMKMQFSPITSWSKAPSEKYKEIQQLSQSGEIQAVKLGKALQLTDIEDVYSNATAVINAVEQCISCAIENGEYEIPDIVSYDELAKEIFLQENKLYSSMNADKKDDKLLVKALDRLLQLEEALAQKMFEMGLIASEEGSNNVTEDDIPETNETDPSTNNVEPTDVNNSNELDSGSTSLSEEVEQ